MEIDQPSSSSSSSTTASVPAALASSSRTIPSTVTVASSNIQHQNGFNDMVNGSSEREGSGANAGPVMNGNVDISNTSQK